MSYDEGKSEELLLFGNSNYKNIIRTTVLFCPVSFFAEKVVKGKEKIAVFCAENDFITAKKVKDSFFKLGAAVSVIAFSENADEKNLLFVAENSDMIVAVGEEPIIKKSKLVAEKSGTKIAAVYSSTKMTEAFSKPYADYIIIDEEFCFSNKKQFLIETFGEVVSSLTDLIDYKVAAVKKAAVYDKGAVTLLLEAINFALLAQSFSDARKALSLAALKISVLKEYSDIFKFSASAEVAKYLPPDSPYGERKFRAFKALTPIYRLYLSCGSLDALPDYVRASKDISDYFKEKEYETVLKFAPPKDEEALKENAKLLTVVRYPILKDLNATLAKYEYIDELYAYLYNGKKKLSSIPPKTLKKAIKAAAYSAENNLLALLKDDGFADFI